MVKLVLELRRGRGAATETVEGSRGKAGKEE